MLDPKTCGKKIIPLDKAISSLGLKLDAFIEALKHNNIFLVILPKHSFSIGIRNRKKVIDLASKSYEDNPFDITVNCVDGFIPHLENNEKILYSLNWKASEPYEIVTTDGKNEFATSENPQELASSKAIQQYKFEVKEAKIFKIVNKMVSASLSYSDQVFFFKGKETYNTELSMKEIFITINGLDVLKEYLSNLHKPDFNDVGGYQENPWSNQLIKDINAIHKYFLDNKMISDDRKKKVAEVKARKWLMQRYNGSKKISNECFEYLPKIVSDQVDSDINFEKILEKEIKDIKIHMDSKTGSPLVAALHEKIKRNREKATDVIILIDIAAEKHFEEKKKHKELRKIGSKGEAKNIDNNYTNRGKFLEILKEVGIERGVIRQAIFSTVKRKLSDIN